MKFRKYKLGELLTRKKEKIKLEDNLYYQRITIRMNHKGITPRDNVQGKTIKSSMFKIKAGDFVLSGIDARNGAFGIVPDSIPNAIITNDFWCLEPKKEKLDKEFFLFLTSTKYFDYICNQSSDGTTQRIRLQKDKFFDYEIKIPDLKSQKQLVTNLQSINNKGLSLSSELSSQLSLIAQLRQSFLREAMEGKLVSNETSDGKTGAELLEEIKAEKERLVKEKKIRKPKKLESIKKEEVPFEIPENWVWCRLGEISNVRDSDRKPISRLEREKREKIYNYYGASGIIDKIDGYTHEGKYILIGEDGNNLLSKSTPLAFIAEGKFWVNNHAHVLEYKNENLFNYMLFWLNIFDIKPYLTGGFQPKFSQGNLNKVLTPLPPLEIQSRIVSKLDELMAYCDELEQSVLASQEQNELLLEQVLREALAG